VQLSGGVVSARYGWFRDEVLEEVLERSSLGSVEGSDDSSSVSDHPVVQI